MDSSDVVIENFSTGVAERLGLGYEALRAGHESLVTVSSSGLGRTGPDTGMRAFGKSIHGFTGHTYLTGWPGTPPRGIGGTWTDPVTGVTAALAIFAGLAHARRTGKGVHFDLSMAEATTALMAEPFLAYLATGAEPVPTGNHVRDCVPHNTYHCAAGGWLAITAHDGAEWDALCTAAGLPAELRALTTLAERQARRTEIDAALDSWCAGQDRDAAASLLQAGGVCCAPVHEFTEVLGDAHFRERNLLMPLQAEGLGPYHIFKPPWVQTPGAPVRYTASPKLGHDNDYVFSAILGLTPGEVDKLAAGNVLV